eukprot:gene3744-2640_t
MIEEGAPPPSSSSSPSLSFSLSLYIYISFLPHLLLFNSLWALLLFYHTIKRRTYSIRPYRSPFLPGSIPDMSRANAFGPNSLYSFTRFGSFPKRDGIAPCRSNQRHMLKDTARERRYAMCTRCGITTMTVNFDQVPSVRIGLWGRCADDKDYTHHRFVDLAPGEYRRLREMTVKKRLDWWNNDKMERKSNWRSFASCFHLPLLLIIICVCFSLSPPPRFDDLTERRMVLLLLCSMSHAQRDPAPIFHTNSEGERD